VGRPILAADGFLAVPEHDCQSQIEKINISSNKSATYAQAHSHPNPGFAGAHATVCRVNARSIRRAAERQTRKAEGAQPRVAANPQTNSSDLSTGRALSEAQLAANRANAQLSTGPRTETGKRLSSVNAVKTGLTGRTVLLPCDDASLYLQHVHRFVHDYKPKGARECELVQSLADTQWRLNRIPGLEMALFARGRVKFAEQFTEYDDQTASALIDAETLVVYQRELRNLHLQENRLRRQYEKDLAELKQLQLQHMFEPPSDAPAPAVPASNGFEFLKKVEELGKRIDKLTPEEMEAEIDALETCFTNQNKVA
jgi:hypothetical protein